MNTRNLKTWLGLAAVALVVVGLVGCSSEPAATPIAERKAGEDITPADRADKRGDVPVVGASASGGKMDTPAETSAQNPGGSTPSIGTPPEGGK